MVLLCPIARISIEKAFEPKFGRSLDSVSPCRPSGTPGITVGGSAPQVLARTRAASAIRCPECRRAHLCEPRMSAL